MVWETPFSRSPVSSDIRTRIQFTDIGLLVVFWMGDKLVFDLCERKLLAKLLFHQKPILKRKLQIHQCFQSGITEGLRAKPCIPGFN